MSRTQPPELLAARHQLAGFHCRSVEQTAWLVQLAKQAHGAGRTPQPIALLARLGVDPRHEGEGLGAALLLEVITRVASLSEASGELQGLGWLWLVPDGTHNHTTRSLERWPSCSITPSVRFTLPKWVLAAVNRDRVPGCGAREASSSPRSRRPGFPPLCTRRRRTSSAFLLSTRWAAAAKQQPDWLPRPAGEQRPPPAPGPGGR